MKIVIFNKKYIVPVPDKEHLKKIQNKLKDSIVSFEKAWTFQSSIFDDPKVLEKAFDVLSCYENIIIFLNEISLQARANLLSLKKDVKKELRKRVIKIKKIEIKRQNAENRSMQGFRYDQIRQMALETAQTAYTAYLRILVFEKALYEIKKEENIQARFFKKYKNLISSQKLLSKIDHQIAELEIENGISNDDIKKISKQAEEFFAPLDKCLKSTCEFNEKVALSIDVVQNKCDTMDSQDDIMTFMVTSAKITQEIENIKTSLIFTDNSSLSDKNSSLSTYNSFVSTDQSNITNNYQTEKNSKNTLSKELKIIEPKRIDFFLDSNDFKSLSPLDVLKETELFMETAFNLSCLQSKSKILPDGSQIQVPGLPNKLQKWCKAGYGNNVMIESGSFMMGSSRYDSFSTCCPVHEVNILNPFLLSACHVTIETAALVLNMAYDTGEIIFSDKQIFTCNRILLLDLRLSFGMSLSEPIDEKTLEIICKSSLCDLPVTGMTWFGAAFLCNLLSRANGLDEVYDPLNWQILPELQGYRLPWEHEWEYAAKFNSPENAKFSGGDNVEKIAWYCMNSENRPHGAARKKPNQAGLYDMTGNILEWCTNSFYDYSQIKSNELEQKDIKGCCSIRKKMALRGGAFDFPIHKILMHERYFELPGKAIKNAGIRLALSL